MKHRVFLIFLMVLSISCTKENSDEYAQGTSQNGIVGKWKLVETNFSDGTAKQNRINVSSSNYVVTFDSNGNVKSPEFACSGKYVFDANKPGNRGDKNLVVTFDDCEPASMAQYSIRGHADARIVDHNNLILNSESCDEACTRVFRRMK